PLGERIELCIFQQFIHSLVEQMAWPLRQFIVADPQPLLPLSAPSCPHRHRGFSRLRWHSTRTSDLRKLCSAANKQKTDFHHRLLEGLLPWATNSELLEKQYRKYLTDRKVANLPDTPSFVFCSTDLSFGVDWIFSKAQTGDYQAGYLPSVPKDWDLSFAVAASSCFPPIFKPLSLGVRAQELEPGKFPPGRT